MKKVVGKGLLVLSMMMLCVAIGGCKKGGSGDKASSGGAKLSAADNPKVGDSCEGLPATAGVMACDGKTKLFCSSHSKYKWKSLGPCKGKCVLGADGKSVSCK